MQDELLDLLCKNAYRKGEYLLSSGRTSEHYVNCKPVTLSGRGLVMVSDMIIDELESDTVAVGGLTLGADPVVSGVAMGASLLDWELAGLIVRKEAKGHGTQAWIEGLLPRERTNITVLEDVIAPVSDLINCTIGIPLKFVPVIFIEVAVAGAIV